MTDKEKIWHDKREKPENNRKVVVWTGCEIVPCLYKFGKFVECIPTEECGHYVDMRTDNGPCKVFISKKKRGDLTPIVERWAYVSDLLEL